MNVAAAYLTLLASRGVETLFGNAGTDFAPLIEGYATLAAEGRPAPRPILATHENLAVTMAHGYGMVSGKVPAVMVHVSVGTANMICGAMNAARENVAILLTAGRTPVTEEGRLGSRDGYIHWAQEMYDQAGLLREVVKWDYELRGADQLATVVDRALAIAASEPRGPVYLALPREVLAEAAVPAPKAARMQPAAAPAPEPRSLAEAARLIEGAARPLIITCNAGRRAEGFQALSAFAERYAIPVIQHKPRYLSLPSAHPMNVGYEPRRLVGEADVILTLECDVPWMPVEARPAEGARVIQAGIDPLHAEIPIRGFASDVTIAGDGALVLEGLAAAMGSASGPSIEARRAWVKARREAYLGEAADQLSRARAGSVIRPAFVSACLGLAKASDAIVVNEYTLMLDHCGFAGPNCYFGSSAVSGLGWGGGAALGAKLAAPGREVIAVLGDGAYLFANPVALHHASAMHGLPVLFVVMNNAMWGAVDRFTAAMYPKGHSSRQNEKVFTRLDNLPAFEKVCEAAGGYGERVEDAAVFPAALERALEVVRTEKRQALLNVICET